MEGGVGSREGMDGEEGMREGRGRRGKMGGEDGRRGNLAVLITCVKGTIVFCVALS